MIDPDKVFQKAANLTDIPSEDEEKLNELCRDSSKSFERKLKEGVTGEEDALIYAAASTALYRYALLKSYSDENFDSIKTGDVTVKRSFTSVLESAEKLLIDAVSEASEYLCDVGFVFRGM